MLLFGAPPRRDGRLPHGPGLARTRCSSPAGKHCAAQKDRAVDAFMQRADGPALHLHARGRGPRPAGDLRGLWGAGRDAPRSTPVGPRTAPTAWARRTACSATTWSAPAAATRRCRKPWGSRSASSCSSWATRSPPRGRPCACRPQEAREHIRILAEQLAQRMEAEQAETRHKSREGETAK